MDKETRAEFDRQQAKREKPECFGNWKSSAKCSHCWFHPDCKIADGFDKGHDLEPKTEKSSGAKLSKPEIMDMLDDLGIEYDKRGKKANLEKLLNEAME